MRAPGESDLKIYGLFGYPLAHTVSPAMQDAALDFYGMKAIYFAFEKSAEKFQYLMKHLKSLQLEGFNVTVPFKEIVIPYLDRLDSMARKIGAVNTVKKQGKKWIGFNTDYQGFLEGLKKARFHAKGKNAVILGAGGASRAVCFGLAHAGIRRLTILDVIEKKAVDIVRSYRKFYPAVEWKVQPMKDEFLEPALKEADLLVNATPIGLHENDPLIVSKAFFPKKRILVYDLIYKPRETPLLKLAKKLGHSVVNGETMLVMQGAKAFEIWTNKKAPVEVMRKAMENALHHK